MNKKKHFCIELCNFFSNFLVNAFDWCNNLLSPKKRFTTVLLDVIESIWIVPKNFLFPLHFLSICFGSSSRRRSERYFKDTQETSPKRKKNKCAVSLWCVNRMLNENVKRKKFTRKIFWLAIRHLNSFSLLMLDLIYLLLLILQLDEYFVEFHNHRRWQKCLNALRKFEM